MIQWLGTMVTTGHKTKQKKHKCGKETFGGAWGGGGRTQVGELTMVDESQERVGIESNQDNIYLYDIVKEQI